MQFGLILGGIFLAFLALTKKKVKNPDPLAAANEAEELSSPQAKFLRIQNSLDVIGKTKKIVLDVGQLTRLNDAIYRAKYGQLFFGIDRSGNYRGYKNKAAYRAYVESLYAPTSLMTYNRELAVRLAGQLADQGVVLNKPCARLSVCSRHPRRRRPSKWSIRRQNDGRTLLFYV